MAAPLQSDQQLLNFVALHVVTCQSRYVMGKGITRRMDIGDVMLLGHLPNAGGDGAILLYRHCFTSGRKIASAGVRIH
jgi:hypothetical protein